MTIDNFKQLISEIANFPVAQINEYSSFKDDLGIDSLQMVNLILEVSSKFEVELTKFQRNEDLTTVGNFYIALTREYE